MSLVRRHDESVLRLGLQIDDERLDEAGESRVGGAGATALLGLRALEQEQLGQAPEEPVLREGLGQEAVGTGLRSRLRSSESVSLVVRMTGQATRSLRRHWMSSTASPSSSCESERMAETPSLATARATAIDVQVRTRSWVCPRKCVSSCWSMGERSQ
jgi:hypothetical protein